jgi:hypothetical protein
MIKYRIEDEFETTVDGYWEMFFSDDYNDGLWEFLDIDREQVEFRKEGEGADEVIHRRQKLVPRREVPKVLKKVVGDAIAYEEVNVFRRKASTMEVTTIPNFLSDKFDAKGTYEVKEIGPGRVIRIWEAYCSCKVPLVGGKIEQHIVGEVQDSYRRTTEFTRRWLAQHAG